MCTKQPGQANRLCPGCIKSRGLAPTSGDASRPADHDKLPGDIGTADSRIQSVVMQSGLRMISADKDTFGSEIGNEQRILVPCIVRRSAAPRPSADPSRGGTIS